MTNLMLPAYDTAFQQLASETTSPHRMSQRRDSIDLWVAALCNGDEAEVERIVRESHGCNFSISVRELIGATSDQSDLV